MTKIYHLSSCSTCQRIIKELDFPMDTIFQDIKTEKITTQQIEDMAHLTGSYNFLFSRRAMKYKSLGLKDQNLTELDYKRLILEEYTFLKRPVILHHNQIFVGNSKKTVEQAQLAIHES